PGVPCPGLNPPYGNAPAPITGLSPLLCAPCPDVFDPSDPRTDKLCAYLPGAPDFRPLPNVLPGGSYRGFDDPQADPDTTKTLIQTQLIVYMRADLYDLGGNPAVYPFRDKANPICP